MSAARIFDLVTCPACQGSKKTTQSLIPTKGRRPCLTCYGSGQVESYRVCQTCGHFRDMCVCRKAGDVVRVLPTVLSGTPVQTEEEFEFGDDDEPDAPVADLPPPEEVKVSKQHNGHIPGVSWNEKQQRWVAQIYRDGKSFTLGSFVDVEKANAIRREAEGLNSAEYPALKVRYGVRVWASKLVEPATKSPVELPHPQESDLPLTSDEGLLISAFARAKAADRRKVELCTAAQVATAIAQEAEREAVDAWNEYARLLHQLAGQDSAIADSVLGQWVDLSDQVEVE